MLYLFPAIFLSDAQFQLVSLANSSYLRSFACCCTFIKQLPLNPLTELSPSLSFLLAAPYLFLPSLVCCTRKMHLPVSVCINHTQNYDARLMANKSGANSRKHWRRLSCIARSACRMRTSAHKSVEFGSFQLVLLLLLCLQLLLLLLLLLRAHSASSCVQLHPAHSQLPFAVLNLVSFSFSVSVTGNLLGCSHCSTLV